MNYKYLETVNELRRVIDELGLKPCMRDFIEIHINEEIVTLEYRRGMDDPIGSWVLLP